jgi:hypothetical protein
MAVPISGVILLLLALFLGLNLPDIDLLVPFLIHRSIITHGFILPLVVFLIISKENSATVRFFSMGFSLASIIHLCFDLFPRAWMGFALIYVPGWGRTSVLFSWLWISLSIIICFYLTFGLISSLLDMVLALGSLGLAFSYYASTQPTFWPALMALLIGLGLTLALPTNSREILHRLILKWRGVGF